MFLLFIDHDEVTQLQARLASTEAQMCKILTALDMASEKVNAMANHPNQSAKVRTQIFNH